MAGIQTTTRWLDTQKTKFEQSDEILRSKHADEIHEDGPSYINWKITPTLEKACLITINGKAVKYNLYRYAFVQVPQDANPDDSIASEISGWLIVYESSLMVHYIIDRHSNAKTYLRKILKYTGRSELRQETTHAYGDLFVWLISKVYRQDNVIENIAEDEPNITIDSIVGFKGDTEDALNKVSASGESVTNILSTLSFLVESQKLKQVTFKAICGTDNISLTLLLTTANTVGVNIAEYLATQDENDDRYSLIARLILNIYLELLPIIVQTYNSELAANKWGKDSCVLFLQDVAHALADKVDARIDDLKTNPEQLKFNSVDKENEESEVKGNDESAI